MTAIEGSYSNWTLHPDSITSGLTIGRRSLASPPLGGFTNQLLFIGDTADYYKSACYYVNLFGNVYGDHEISGVFQIPPNDISMGLVAMWDANHLTDTASAYVLELTGVDGDERLLTVHQGPSRFGQLIYQNPVVIPSNRWLQFLIQFNFDQVGNLQLYLAWSDAAVTPIQTPAWQLIDYPIEIPVGTQIRTNGRCGFLMESKDASFTTYFDYFHINTDLSDLGTTVDGLGNPYAYFAFTIASLTVTFTDQSSPGFTSSIAHWAWNFGDSNTSTSQNPSHTYGAHGIYNVVLTITTASSATATITIAVTV